jgi:RNA polymerase sigma-70 factor (ECF subfamily)
MNFFTVKSSEDKLIIACQKGEHHAQKAVYEKYARKMLGVCSRYVQDEMEAEDIMIMGFVRVFEKINTFKSEGSFEGWIRRIMVNEALGHLRKQKSLKLTVNLEDSYQEPVFTAEDTELEAEDLLILIQQLPDGYRMVFNLYAIEGYSHKEIGEMLGISENTSKSQLSRARSLLQRHIERTEKKSEAVG